MIHNSVVPKEDYSSETAVPVIEEALKCLTVPQGNYQVKILFRDGTTPHFNVFTDLREMRQYAEKYDGNPNVKAIWTNLNPLKEGVRNATKPNIKSIQRLLIDCDPKREDSDSNSTDFQYRASLAKAQEIKSYLSSLGWSEPIVANSGNGGHLVYGVDLPATDESERLVMLVLKALRGLFATKLVDIDPSVGNRNRMVKLYGTMTRKGEHTAEKPQRRSSIISAPSKLVTITHEQLKAKVESKAIEKAEDEELVVTVEGFAMPGKIHEMRNVSLTSVAGKLRNIGLDAEEIEAALAVVNEKRCIVPLDTEEVSRIACSIGKYEPDEELPTIESSMLNIIGRNEMRHTVYAPVSDVIFGLETGAVGMVSAFPDAGKSSIARNLLLSMACGRSYAPLFDGGVALRCLHLDLETLPKLANDDLTKMEDEACFSDEERRLIGGNLFVVNTLSEDKKGMTLFLSEPKGLKQLQETISTLKLQFVVIDTLTAAWIMKDENNNSVVNEAVIQPLRKIARDTRCSILLLHHFGKGSEGSSNSQPIYKARGASVFGANLPASFVLDSPQGKKDEDQRVTWRFGKVKRGEYRKDTVLLKPVGSRWYRATDEETKSSAEASLEAMLELITCPMSRTEIVMACETSNIAKKSKVYELIKEAIEKRKLEQEGDKFRKVEGIPFS